MLGSTAYIYDDEASLVPTISSASGPRSTLIAAPGALMDRFEDIGGLGMGLIGSAHSVGLLSLVCRPGSNRHPFTGNAWLEVSRYCADHSQGVRSAQLSVGGDYRPQAALSNIRNLHLSEL